MTKVVGKYKEDCESVLGTFIDDSHFDEVISEDMDLYAIDPLEPTKKDESNIIFKFRKGVFTKKEQDSAYEGLRNAATESQNRGMAAGPRGDRLNSQGRGGRDWVTDYQFSVIDYYENPPLIDEFPQKGEQKVDETRGIVWLRSKITPRFGQYEGWFDKWLEETKDLSKEQRAQAAKEVRSYMSDTNYAQSVMSGIAGFYDRYPRVPFGRACGYNDRYPELFAKSFPYLRKLNDVFKRELPARWGAQRAAADKLDPRFLIDETVFTTLTVNYDFRTAAHRDAGDLSSGFSNISGIGKGWKGCIFTLPEYRIGINLQPGDLLLVNNHEGIHGNTEFEGNDNDRVSIVAYFREKMLDLKSWKYENLRKQFVEERRKDPNHKYQRHLWNGVSPNMWSSDEWGDYLKKHNMDDEDRIVNTSNTLF